MATRAGSARALAVGALTLLIACQSVANEPSQADVAPSAESSVAPSEPPTASRVAPAESSAPIVADGEEWILFSSAIDERGEDAPHDAIFLVRPDGTDQHRMALNDGSPFTPRGSEIRPTWSPEGTQLTWVQVDPEPDEPHTLWVADADGANARAVYTCETTCNTIDNPDWASDGAIYVSYDANIGAEGIPLTFGVMRVDPTTGAAEELLAHEDGMTLIQPRISPDARRVAFTRERDPFDITQGTALFVANLDGSDEFQLTEWRDFAAYPDWSIDGRIAFNTYDLRMHPWYTSPGGQAPHNLYTVLPDGSDLRQLTHFGPNDTRCESPMAAQPRWTPDGTGITFSLVECGEAVMAYIEPDGTGQRTLTPQPVAGSGTELRPVTDR